MKKLSFVFKILILTFTASILLCSCEAVKEAASSIAGEALNSAKAELSSVLSEGISGLAEGMDDLSEEMDSIKSAASEVSDNVLSAVTDIPDIISEKISSSAESVSEELSSNNVLSAVTDIPDIISEKISSAAESVSEEISSNIAEATDELITATTADTTAPPQSTASSKWYTFRNKTRYDEHYKKHGAEFGSITKEEYLQLANDLINSTSDRVLHKYSEDGDYMYFDQDTGYFLVLSEDGYIRTFFVPKAGIDYWNRQ